MASITRDTWWTIHLASKLLTDAGIALGIGWYLTTPSAQHSTIALATLISASALGIIINDLLRAQTPAALTRGRAQQSTTASVLGRALLTVTGLWLGTDPLTPEAAALTALWAILFLADGSLRTLACLAHLTRASILPPLATLVAAIAWIAAVDAATIHRAMPLAIALIVLYVSAATIAQLLAPRSRRATHSTPSMTSLS